MSTAEFVPLAELLAARAAPDAPTHADDGDGRSADVRDAQLVADDLCAAGPSPQPPPRDDDAARAVRDVRLFRARLRDALDDAFAGLLAALAADVLARELRLAPCDLAALLARARDGAPVVRVRVAPEDQRDLDGCAVVPDAALQPGDLVLDVDGGALDLRLGVRLATVLERFA